MTEEKKAHCPVPGSSVRTGLRHGYMSVIHGGCPSFGGNQEWFSGMLRICGCGIIGAADLLWYLQSKDHRIHPEFDRYEKYVRSIRKSFAVIPFKGMPGFLMSACLNIYMIRKRLKFRARWGVLPRNIGRQAYRMLADDIPVPFCVGPGIHMLLKNKEERGIGLYIRRADGSFSLSKRARNHFMVMTAAEGDMAEVSSWGEKYFINIRELEEYSLRDAFGLFTNIVFIRRI